MAVWNFIYSNILTNAAYFLAILVFVGQLLNKKTILEASVSAIKCFIGYHVFSIATGGLGTTFRPIFNNMKNLFGFTITVNESYYGQSTMLAKYQAEGGPEGAYMISMAVEFGVLLLLAFLKKFSKVRTLVIQGHILQGFAMNAVFFVHAAFGNISSTSLIVMGGLLVGCYLAVCSNLTVEPCQDLTDGVGMCVGHTQMIGDRVAWEIGKRIEKKSIEKTGKKPMNFDNLELPGWLDIFSDTYVSSFIVMLVFFAIIMMALGKQSFIDAGSITEADNFAIYIILIASRFPVYLLILSTGMRMFVAEIQDGFQGLSSRIFKGILPGLDCAAFYGFCSNPNVITLSFLSGALMMIAFTIIGVILRLPFVVMVGFTQMMFDNATVGIFGHHRGGIKGLFIGTAICAAVDTFLCGIVAYVLGFTEWAGIACQFDWSVILSISSPLWKALGYVGFAVSIIALLAVPQVQYMLTKDKSDYWLVAEDYEQYKEKHGIVAAAED